MKVSSAIHQVMEKWINKRKEKSFSMWITGATKLIKLLSYLQLLKAGELDVSDVEKDIKKTKECEQQNKGGNNENE